MDEYIVVYLDMLGRGKVMENLLIVLLCVNCFCVMLLVVISNIVVVFWFINLVEKIEERKVLGKGN